MCNKFRGENVQIGSVAWLPLDDNSCWSVTAIGIAMTFQG
jgi:hypothetical protein